MFTCSLICIYDDLLDPRFEKEGKGSFPIFSLSQSCEKHPTMSTQSECLPCFTKSGGKHLWHGGLKRWLTARERLAASGLAVSEGQALASHTKAPVDWQSDYGWHARVGNGNQLQNVGTVLIAVLGSLRLKSDVPSIPPIEPASCPDGLSLVNGTYKLEVGKAIFDVGTDKAIAILTHRAVHETLVETPKGSFSYFGVKRALFKWW